MALQPPPRDADSNIVPHDAPDIDDADILVRRISGHHITGEDGRRRISSMAYKSSTDGTGMSVDILKLIEEAGVDPRAYVTSEAFFCSVRFEARDLRADNLQVGYFPLPRSPYHGAVWGIVSRGQMNRLRRLARWFVEGEGIALDDAA